jgi:hypothetical protein
MRDIGVRIGIVLLAVLCSAFLLLCVSVQARPDDEPDDWDSSLVERYLTMPCDAMSSSYEFMYDRIQRTSAELEACYAMAENSKAKYPGLNCLWIKQDFDFRYVHMKSLERAYDVMCDEDGQRKEPEIEISF